MSQKHPSIVFLMETKKTEGNNGEMENQVWISWKLLCGKKGYGRGFDSMVKEGKWSGSECKLTKLGGVRVHKEIEEAWDILFVYGRPEDDRR